MFEAGEGAARERHRPGPASTVGLLAAVVFGRVPRSEARRLDRGLARCRSDHRERFVHPAVDEQVPRREPVEQEAGNGDHERAGDRPSERVAMDRALHGRGDLHARPPVPAPFPAVTRVPALATGNGRTTGSPPRTDPGSEAELGLGSARRGEHVSNIAEPALAGDHRLPSLIGVPAEGPAPRSAAISADHRSSRCRRRWVGDRRGSARGSTAPPRPRSARGGRHPPSIQRAARTLTDRLREAFRLLKSAREGRFVRFPQHPRYMMGR
jgi:hypothetical protein